MNLILSLLSVVAVASITQTTYAADDSSEKPSRSEFREAMKLCLSEVGVVAVEGEQPKIDEGTREKVDACLVAKGFEPRKHPRMNREDREKMHACLESKGIEKPNRKRGERPVLDQATRKAMDECRSTISS